MPTIPKFIKATDDLFVYSEVGGVAQPGATTQAQIQEFMRNNSDVLQCLVVGLWQPQTAYAVNDIVQSPNMPAGLVAKVTKAGTTSGSEPSWSSSVGATVEDGNVRYSMLTLDTSAFLPLTGGTLTGTLSIQKNNGYGLINLKTANNRERRLDISDTYLRLAVMTDEDDEAGGRYVVLDAGNQLENGLTFQTNDNGTWKTYKIYGAHNLATQVDAEVGTNNEKPMTPLRVAQAINALATPKGTILPFAGGTIPRGFLACNGAAVSRTTYAALFSAIGTTYGSGDGSTTFNLPAVEDNRFLEFSSTRGTKKNAGLPDITGSMTLRQTNTGTGASGRGAIGNVSGAFSMTTDVDAVNFSYLNLGGQGQTADLVTLDATKSSSVYGNSTTVQPKSLTVRAIIKY